MLSRIKSTRGFSLIELAVVLIIIGLIAAIAIPTFQTVIERSEKRAVESTAQALVRNLDALAGFESGAVTEANVKAALEESSGNTVTIATGEATTTGDGFTYTLVDVDTSGTVTSGDTITVSNDNYEAVVTLDNPRSSSGAAAAVTP